MACDVSAEHIGPCGPNCILHDFHARPDGDDSPRSCPPEHQQHFLVAIRHSGMPSERQWQHVMEWAEEWQEKLAAATTRQRSDEDQLVWLADWCRRTLRVENNKVIGSEGWPNRLVEVVAKAADDCFAKAFAEIGRLTEWINDLHSGMYINCVYCGFRYGPKDEVASSMADALKEHVESCPKHPMSALKMKADRMVKLLDTAEAALRSYQYGNYAPDLAQEVADAIAEARS